MELSPAKNSTCTKTDQTYGEVGARNPASSQSKSFGLFRKMSTSRGLLRNPPKTSKVPRFSSEPQMAKMEEGRLVKWVQELLSKSDIKAHTLIQKRTFGDSAIFDEAVVREAHPTLVEDYVRAVADRMAMATIVNGLAARWRHSAADAKTEAALLWQIRELQTTCTSDFDDAVLQRFTLGLLPVYADLALRKMNLIAERTDLTRKIVQKLDKGMLFVPVLMAHTDRELEEGCCSEDVLFREHSLSTRLSVVYSGTKTQGYLQDLVGGLVKKVKKHSRCLEDYVVNPAHHRDGAAAERRIDRFEKLVTAVVKPFLETLEIDPDIGMVLNIRCQAVSRKYRDELGLTLADSLFWLRIFGAELDRQFRAADRVPSTPLWSIVYSIHRLLVTLSSRQEPAPSEISSEQQAGWSKRNYETALLRSYKVLWPAFSRLSSQYTHIKLWRVKGLNL